MAINKDLLPRDKEGKFEQLVEYIRWFIWQILLTLSHEPSFFSSKRIERMIIFINAAISLDICIDYLVKHDKIDWVAAVGIYAAQMVYAGYQTKQIYNDVKKEKLANADIDSTDPKQL